MVPKEDLSCITAEMLSRNWLLGREGGWSDEATLSSGRFECSHRIWSRRQRCSGGVQDVHLSLNTWKKRLFFSLAALFIKTLDCSVEVFGSLFIESSRSFINRVICVCEEFVVHLHCGKHFNSLCIWKKKSLWSRTLCLEHILTASTIFVNILS